MGSHINSEGKFQSDKYPTCPAGKVPLSVEDPTAQDLLWAYAERRRVVDAEFADDLRTCLIAAGYRRVATSESAFDRVLPDTDPKQDPGWRLHIFRELDESMIVFSEECVLPEKVLDPDARVMFAKMRVWLTTEQQRWLRDQLNALLGEG